MIARPGPVGWALGRVLWAAVSVCGAAAVVWCCVVALPGDPATTILGQNATPERVSELRERLGLARPLPEQLVDWMAGVLRADFGESLISGQPVGDLIVDRGVNSLALAVVAGAFILAVGLPLGVIAGLRSRGVTGRALSGGAMVAAAVPDFVVGTVLIGAFAVSLRVLPSLSTVPSDDTAWQHPLGLVIPAVALSIGLSGWAIRYVRAVVVEQTTAPHVVAARLAGQPEHRVLTRHLGPGALAPIVQFFGWMIALLIGGAVVVEQLVGFPGIGSLLVESVANRDLTTVTGVTVVLAIAVAAALVVSDVAALALDPRLRPWRG